MKKSIAVLGLGKYGTSIALELARSGAEVLAVDLKEERIKEVAPMFATQRLSKRWVLETWMQ